MLSPKEARQFYDNFGKKQDHQFYERVPLKLLIDQSDFATARFVFEFGCGTGRLAELLLQSYLSEASSYQAIDISDVMVSLSRQRLARFAKQIQIDCSDGNFELQLHNSSVDRFVSTYVLELLNITDIQLLLKEAHRILADRGLLCLAVLSHGNTFISRRVSKIWTAIHKYRPMLVGGCRPINLASQLPKDMWRFKHNQTMVSWGVPSQVIVAEKMSQQQ